jgi:hypothetical protein
MSDFISAAVEGIFDGLLSSVFRVPGSRARIRRARRRRNAYAVGNWVMVPVEIFLSVRRDGAVGGVVDGSTRKKWFEIMVQKGVAKKEFGWWDEGSLGSFPEFLERALLEQRILADESVECVVHLDPWQTARMRCQASDLDILCSAFLTDQ